MGNTVRNRLVLSLTSIAIIATTAWADRPTKQECAESCNEFTAELVGSSDQSASLNRKQRSAVANSIRQVAKQCIRLCGFSVVDIDTLAELIATLRQSEGNGAQSTTTPLRAPKYSTPTPSPVRTATPVPTSTSMPVATATPYPTVALTAAPELTVVAEPVAPNEPYAPPGIG